MDQRAATANETGRISSVQQEHKHSGISKQQGCISKNLWDSYKRKEQ